MSRLPTNLHINPAQIGAVALFLVVSTGVGAYLYLHRRIDPKEIERLRREFLATQGRITDATLIDTLSQAGQLTSPDSPPNLLQYQYRVAGVAYESSQDVSALPGHVMNVRVDLPIQVRYDPHNPGNSIVVAETWSGLRLDPEPEP